jgi:ribosomal protein L29
MEQGAAARGKLLSGQQQKALQAYGQQMGSQEYQNTFNRAASEWGMNADRLKNNYNMLNNLNMQGQQSANALAGLRGQLADTRIQGIYGNLGNQMGARQMKGDIAVNQGNQMAEMGSSLMGWGMGNMFGPSGGGQQPQQGNTYEVAPQKYVPFTQ